MSPPTETLQRISRLAPLPEIWARVEAFAPVAPKAVEPAGAVGATLAGGVEIDAAHPAGPVALRDGWAVASDLVLDAGPYAPVPLVPPPAWVEAGDPMPAGTDAVLPLDAVTVTSVGAEAHTAAAPGDGVLAAGADAEQGAILRRPGERLRAIDVSVLRAAGIAKLSVRVPRIKVFCASVPTRSKADTISPLLVRAIEAEGGDAQLTQADSLESALLDPACDAIVTIGGTGSGRRDAAIRTLARIGRVEIHGFGIAPGETAALGRAGERPVLMLPGRLDAALAVWLVVGRRLIAQLAGRIQSEPGIPTKLTRKVTSTIGLADVVLVRRNEDGIEPVANGFFTWSTLACADGWIVVSPESEGFAAGAAVEMRPLP